MLKVIFNLRNVVTIAICLTVIIMFSKCGSKDSELKPEEPESPTSVVKFIKRINIYNGGNDIYDFQYNTQNKLTSIATNSRTLSIGYPNANTIVISSESNIILTLTLNHDGSIASRPRFGDEETLEYLNGYLQKMIILSAAVDMNGDGIIDYGTSTITNTWENENLKTAVSKYISPTYIHIDTVIYEYDTLLNNPCSLDMARIIMSVTTVDEVYLYPWGWFGKATNNLPSKITISRQFYSYDNDYNYNTTRTYRYETDSDDYPLKIFVREWIEWRNDYEEERLLYTINYL